MVEFTIEQSDLHERILAVYADNCLYVGLGCKFLNFTTGKVLSTFDKSVRCITGNEKCIAAGSYDGTVELFAEKIILIDTSSEKIAPIDMNSEKIAPIDASKEICTNNSGLKKLIIDDSISVVNSHIERIEGPETEIKAISLKDDSMAIATRGRSVWILENLEVSKILDDHTQDVKGCRFHNDRLFTWSYDCHLKIYEFFDLDDSWELAQSIDLGETVWDACVFDDRIVAVLQSGYAVLVVIENGLWIVRKRVKFSVYPIFSCCSDGSKIGLISNRNVFSLIDCDLNLLGETRPLTENKDVFCCCYWPKKNLFVTGGDDGKLTFISIAGCGQKDSVDNNNV